MTDLGVAFITRTEYSVSIRGRTIDAQAWSVTKDTSPHKSGCLAARGMHDGRVLTWQPRPVHPAPGVEVEVEVEVEGATRSLLSAPALLILIPLCGASAQLRWPQLTAGRRMHSGVVTSMPPHRRIAATCNSRDLATQLSTSRTIGRRQDFD